MTSLTPNKKIAAFLRTKDLVLASMLTFLLSGCGEGDQHRISESDTKSSQDQLQKESDSGKRLYMANCAVCHGVQGKGDGIASVALKNPLNSFETSLSRMSDQEISRIILEGRGEMMAWSDHLNESQVLELIKHLRNIH